MGLDIFFYRRRFDTDEEFDKAFDETNPNKVAAEQYEKAKKEGFSHYKSETDVCKMTLAMTYRKKSFLMDYFDYYGKCREEGDDNGVSTYVVIPIDEIQSFIEDAEHLLHKREYGGVISKESSPIKPMDGFGFGSQEMDDDFYEGVELCLCEFQELLSEVDEFGEIVYMYASW